MKKILLSLRYLPLIPIGWFLGQLVAYIVIKAMTFLGIADEVFALLDFITIKL